MNYRNLIIIVCSILLISACSNRAIVNSTTTDSNHGNALTMNPFKTSHTTTLLVFMNSYSNLTPEMQKKVFAETNQMLTENKSHVLNRLKLASMLALPGSRLRDNAKAQLLLQELLQDNALASSDQALISLLYEYTTDNARQLQKSREDIKKLESMQQKYEVMELKNKSLEQKLNELKNIEKTMSDRDAKSGN